MANNLTVVRLLTVPLERDNLHTLYFNNLDAQTSYFTGRTVKTVENCTYQRKDKIIRFPENYDDIMNCNYVMYKNSAYSGKWFYAFILKMEYVNDGRTDIYIETDPLQTWMMEYDVKPSFVEREHVDSDEIGEHTVPEQLETGDYICGYYNKAEYAKSGDLMIVVGVTKDASGAKVTGDVYNNIYSGVKYYAFSNNSGGVSALNEFINTYPEDGAMDAITCMFLAPKKLGFKGNGVPLTYTNFADTHYINNSDGGEINTTIAFTNNLFEGYTPRNKKLSCYPYRYLLASNNNGASAIYKFERFFVRNDVVRTMIPPMFKIDGAISIGCSVRMYPMNYNGIEKNQSEGITLGKFPALNWNVDVYTNWLTQNAVNIPVSLGSSVASIGMGIAGIMASPTTGGFSAIAGAGAIASGIQGVASTVGEIYSHSLQPPQAEGNLNSGDVITATGDNDFHFYEMTIREEYARIIDGYFDMYGYKVNTVKKPSYDHRQNYWYTKTVDVNIDGNIPADDMQKIKDCYNRGITFWSNPNNIGNYSVPNGITG